MKKENKFLKNTAVLMASGIVVKVLSAIYRIFAIRMVGATGMGKYTVVFSVFMPFYAFATSGITPTISKLCATAGGDSARILQIKKSASLYFGLSSLVTIFCAVMFAWFYGNASDNSLLVIGVVILCFNLFFATFEAVYKGISQGNFKMETTAKANILESGVKIIILIIFLSLIAVNNDENTEIIALFLTVSLAGLVCMVYLQADFYRHYDLKRKSNLLKPGLFYSVSVPISLSALLVTLVNFFDTVVCLPVIKSLNDSVLMASFPFVSFISEKEKAVWLYGVYQGICMSIVGIIPSFSVSIGASTLPLIAESVRDNDYQKTSYHISKLVKFTSAIVIPASLFISFYAYDLVSLLYGSKGSQSTLGAYFVSVMAPSAIFTSFSYPLNSILHAYEKSSSIFKILLFSSIIRISLCYYLCGLEKVNIMGFIYSSIVFNLLVFVLSVLKVKFVDKNIKIVSHIVTPLLLTYILLTAVRFATDNIAFNYSLTKLIVCAFLFAVPYVIALFGIQYFIE